MAELEGEERVIAAAHRIIRSLGRGGGREDRGEEAVATDAMADDMMRILSNFDGRFSHITTPEEETSEEGRSETRRKISDAEYDVSLDAAEEIILRWDLPPSDDSRTPLICKDCPDQLPPYLAAVDALRRIIQRFSIIPAHTPSLDRAQNVLQLAMFRLEEELTGLLHEHSESVDPQWLLDPVSGPSSASNRDDYASQSSDAEEEHPDADRESCDIAMPSRPIVADFNFTIDMLPSEILPSLIGIVNRMVTAGYKTECCHSYISIRKASVEESLYRLGLEKFSIEDIQRMQLETLETEIVNWNQVVKIAVGVLFSSEKQLCDEVFTCDPSVSEYCFAEVARGAMMQLLNFAEAVAIRRRSPEKLFKILDMYETLRDLLPKIESIFSGDTNANLRSEASGILSHLGEAARGTFAEFENAVQQETSRNPVPGGAVHPLTRYVMNYIRFLSDYTDTLNRLLGGNENGSPSRTRNDSNSRIGAGRDGCSSQESPLCSQMVTFLQLLESNLDEKSKLYRDPALSYVFMMNNYNYILQKVKDSEVRTLLGDDWLRRQTGKVRQNHNGYQRAAWTKVLNCLKDEGIHVSGSFSSGVSKTVLKERFRNFNAAFEDILKSQSSWVVSDSRLCTELRISIAEMVIPAYRSFLGRFRNHLDGEKHPEKYLKYSVDELEGHLNDLFEGAPGSMNKK